MLHDAALLCLRSAFFLIEDEQDLNFFFSKMNIVMSKAKRKWRERKFNVDRRREII